MCFRVITLFTRKCIGRWGKGFWLVVSGVVGVPFLPNSAGFNIIMREQKRMLTTRGTLKSPSKSKGNGVNVVVIRIGVRLDAVVYGDSLN